MALHLGELVAGIRASDEGFRHGLREAQLLMAGFTRMSDGRLRDMHGRFVTEGEAMGHTLGARIARGARTAVSALKTVSVAVAGLGVGVPAVAAVTTALGGLAAGAASAGLAVKAFTLAAKPQLDAVADASEAAQKAEDAHDKATRKKAEAQKLAAKGGDDYKRALRESESAARAAKDADAALEQQMKGMPPATRDTAKALAGLKDDYKDWSNSLAPTTMPLFTKGIGILRDLLPSLTPFVKAAAGAFGDFLGRVAQGVKSARFKEWADDMSAAAGPALSNFLAVIRNLAVGFGGLLQAFLPVSSGMTGGLVSMTAAFASWGASLKASEGFAQFMELAREGGKTLGELALAVGNLLVALAPMIGVTTQVALALARVINALPPGVLSVLATAILSVTVAMKAYALGAGVVAAANALIASSAVRAIAAWVRMMAVGIAAYVRIGAAAVASAATTSAAWIGSAVTSIAAWLAAVVRAGITSAATFVMMAARAVVWAATMAASWIIAMGPVGWVIAAVIGLTALIVANWDKIKAWTLSAWNWIVAKLVWAKDMMIQAFLNFTLVGLLIKHWSSIKSGAVTAWNATVGWLRGVPGMIYNAFLNFTPIGLLIKHWNSIKTTAVLKMLDLIAWMRGLPGRISAAIGSLGSLLVEKGRQVIQGLWNGISGMGGWLYNKIAGFAKSSVSGAIKGALGISSPSKVTKAQGRWVARGLIVGMTGSAKQVKAASMKLSDIVRDSLGRGGRRTKALGRIGKDTKGLLRLAGREEKLAARMKTASKALTDAVKARDKLSADVKKGVLEGANITQGDTGGWPMTANTILAGLQADTKNAQKFARDLSTLRKKGVRGDLIAQIAQAGVEQGGAAASALANANSGQVKQINAQQKALVVAAGQAGSVAGNAMYGAGVAAAQGLVKGLKAQQSAIERQMLTIARGMSKAIRKALGIKSPSRVMAAIGQYIPAGLQQGIESGRSAVDRTMQNLVSTPSPGQVSASTGAASAVPGGVGSGTTTLRIEVAGPDEVKRLIRTIVKNDGRGDVQVAFGR